jgi:hypothetical protein
MADIGKPVRKIRIEPERGPDPEAPKRPEPERPEKEPVPAR